MIKEEIDSAESANIEKDSIPEEVVTLEEVTMSEEVVTPEKAMQSEDVATPEEIAMAEEAMQSEEAKRLEAAMRLEEAIRRQEPAVNVIQKIKPKPWSELDVRGKCKRALFFALAIFLVSALTFITVYACVVSGKGARAQVVSEVEVSIDVLLREVAAKGNGVRVPENLRGDEVAYYLVGKEPFDLRKGQYPPELESYTIRVLKSPLNSMAAEIFVFRLHGYVAEGAPLGAEDGELVSPFEDGVREKVEKLHSEFFDTYTATVLRGGHRYVFSAGALNSGAIDGAEQLSFFRSFCKSIFEQL